MEQPGPFGLSDVDIERYARHLILPGFGGRAQRVLLDARVVLHGDGQAAGEALLFLAAAGVGRIAVGPGVPAADVAHARALNGGVAVMTAAETEGGLHVGGDVRLDGALAAMAAIARLAGLGGWEENGWRGGEALAAFCGRG